MPKGKKFDAAQKHFEKRETKFNATLATKIARIQELEDEVRALTEKNISLQEQLDNVTGKLLALEQISEMDPAMVQDYITELRRKNDNDDSIKSLLKFARGVSPFA